MKENIVAAISQLVWLHKLLIIDPDVNEIILNMFQKYQLSEHS